MNTFQAGDEVFCVSSDGMDRLIIGNKYTVDYVYSNKEISVKEITGYVHWSKRFEPVKSKIELIDDLAELLKEWRNGFGRTQSGLNKLRTKTDHLLEIVDNTDFSLEDPIGWANSNDLVQDGYSHTFTVRSEQPANGYVDGGLAVALYTRPQK